MTVVADRERLVRDLVRLRRAQSQQPGNADLATVRADLETMVGGSVSRALAARVLNVSRPALNKRIDLGDVPTVFARDGRWEVPVGALVDLAEAVERVPAGSPARSALGAVLDARRAAADSLLDEDVLPAAYLREPVTHTHRRPELLSLAAHRLIARRLTPQLVADARTRLTRWRQQERIHPTYADAWERLLTLPVDEIARALVEDDERSRDLRQNSPFAGALTEPERRRVTEVVSR